MYDVAIVGGGPGGSTTACMLKKYMPSLRVLVIEKEEFPRDHIGESQLPPIGRILHEIGAWDKIEAAKFPVKIGATYTWGKTRDAWTFGFIPLSEIHDDPRPAPYAGWRQRVAMQVDRAKYDEILLNHARELGAEVFQPEKVSKVHFHQNGQGPVIDRLELDSGRSVEAKWYIDASGNPAVLRRQMGVQVDAPTLLRNVAFWDYFSKPGLNLSLKEKGAMRILIRSVPFGWLWYIALSEHRTSVGLVCNAEYYKQSGKRPDALFRDALAMEKQLSGLLEGAECRGKLETTNDWSYVAERACGKNWFLVGECLGFADPILSAGLTLTHTCAHHCACTILDIERQPGDEAWLKDQYSLIQTRRVRQHMKFAEYWYTGNGLFDAILENCSKIAAASGIVLTPAQAFAWLSHGGVDDIPGQFAIGGLGLSGIKSVQKRFTHDGGDVTYMIDGMTTFELQDAGAVRTEMAVPEMGKISRVPMLERGESRWPLTGIYGIVYSALRMHRSADQLLGAIRHAIAASVPDVANQKAAFAQAIQSIEALASQGWVKCSKEPGRAALSVSTPDEGDIVYTERLGPREARKG